MLHLSGSLLGTQNQNYSFDPNTSTFEKECVDKGFSKENLKELEELSLGTYKFPTFPPQKVSSFYEKYFVLEDRFIPWVFCMKPSEYKTQLINFAQGIVSELNKDPKTLAYYKKTFLPSNKVFELLHPMKAYTFDNEEDSKGTVAKSFTSENKNEYLPITKYNRTTSTTGRLKVEKGPEILLLKKQIRNKIFSCSSRFTNGKIYEFDYKSLEPRVLLSKTKPNKSIPLDIYEDIKSTVFKNNPNLSRETVKKVSLTLLYGGNAETIKNESTDSTRGLYKPVFQTGGERVEVDELCDKINEYFGIEEFKEQLIRENSENGFIRNEFGRKISTDNARNSILVNYWTQSTAIDIALMGFSKLTNSQQNCSSFLPLYVLTDALYVDVDETEWTSEEIQKEVEFSCSKELFLGQNFPVGIKRITE